MLRRVLLRVESGFRANRQRQHDCLGSATAGKCTAAVGAGTTPKSMDELGGPSLMATLNWLFIKGYFKAAQDMQIEHRKLYGPLWKSTFGPLTVVNVANADMIEQVMRGEGRYPVRANMPHWRLYRDMRNQAQGPLTEVGVKWQHIRSILNPRMLKPNHVSGYTNTINEVVTDFITRVGGLRETSGQGVMVNHLTEELYKFAFEGICSVLFETRMGCMNNVVPEETEKFIISVGEMFRLSQVVIFFPRSTWPYLPFWKQFVAAWDHLFKVSEKLVLKKMNDIEQMVDREQELEGAYLTHLLLSDKMTVTEILGSITELLLAGVDTTSNTISWCLYNLAKKPEIQEKVYQEVMSVCPGDQMPVSEDFSRMPYLKAVIRETLRMYPVVPGNARVTVDNEIVVGGHLFPKQTMFHLCHYAVSYDKDVFPDPYCFLPQRWLREEKEKSRNHAFGSIPFGFGIRACLGRRVAELEMHLLLARLIKQYELKPDPEGTEVKALTRTLLCPAQPISLQFLDRGA